eukprot:SAG22_NODE_60_length_23423_cov_8.445250_13_plen_147_part_00
MAALRAGGGLGIADRAKIRLLVGDREHLARVSGIILDQNHNGQGEQAAPRHRQLQEEDGGAADRSTLSAAFDPNIDFKGLTWGHTHIHRFVVVRRHLACGLSVSVLGGRSGTNAAAAAPDCSVLDREELMCVRANVAAPPVRDTGY